MKDAADNQQQQQCHVEAAAVSSSLRMVAPATVVLGVNNVITYYCCTYSLAVHDWMQACIPEHTTKAVCRTDTANSAALVPGAVMRRQQQCHQNYLCTAARTRTALSTVLRSVVAFIA